VAVCAVIQVTPMPENAHARRKMFLVVGLVILVCPVPTIIKNLLWQNFRIEFPIFSYALIGLAGGIARGSLRCMMIGTFIGLLLHYLSDYLQFHLIGIGWGGITWYLKCIGASACLGGILSGAIHAEGQQMVSSFLKGAKYGAFFFG